MTAAAERARSTLARAATHWADHSARAPGSWTDGPQADVRARYTANCLRELDGFLRVLLDEVAPVSGPAERNTANRLARLSVAGPAGPSAVSARLRALGRSSACLYHCGGWVRRADQAAGSWMTAGWPAADGDALRRYGLGERLRPGEAEVSNICSFYCDLGAALG